MPSHFEEKRVGNRRHDDERRETFDRRIVPERRRVVVSVTVERRWGPRRGPSPDRRAGLERRLTGERRTSITRPVG